MDWVRLGWVSWVCMRLNEAGWVYMRLEEVSRGKDVYVWVRRLAMKGWVNEGNFLKAGSSSR